MANDNSLENVDPVDIELAALAKKLSNDPATRKDFLRLVKKHNPAQPIPELDVEDRISALAAPHIQKVAKLEADLLKRDVAGRIEEKRSALREQGYSRDDVAAIEKLMVEKQIPSHDTAASYFKMEKQTATPTPAAAPIPIPPAASVSGASAGSASGSAEAAGATGCAVGAAAGVRAGDDAGVPVSRVVVRGAEHHVGRGVRL